MPNNLSDNIKGIINGLCFLMADAGLNEGQRLTMERMLRNATDAMTEAFRIEAKSYCCLAKWEDSTNAHSENCITR